MWADFSGKPYSRVQFAERIAKLNWTTWKPIGITLHNTAAPTLAQWVESGPAHAARIRNLQSYYEGMGWHGGPHWFISRNWLNEFSNPLRRGTHSPGFNATHIGIEMVGDYSREPFNTGDGALVRDNSVFAMAVFCRKFGWDPAKVIKFHKDDPKTTHDCPGKFVVKADVIARVKAEMARLDGKLVPALPDKDDGPADPPPKWKAPDHPAFATTGDQRRRMAKAIIDFEARKDKKGRLMVYRLPAGDTGGTYEVAGINDRYHPAEAAKLKAMVEAGKHAEVDAFVEYFILRSTAVAAEWVTDPGIEFYLRDCVHHRGQKGAARILQRALGVDDDGDIGAETRAALARVASAAMLPRLRTARESYEITAYGKRVQFWKDFVIRWDKAVVIAQGFQAEPVQAKPFPKVIEVKPKTALPGAKTGVLTATSGAMLAAIGWFGTNPWWTAAIGIGCAGLVIAAIEMVKRIEK